jgi:1-acyl-sn-glycerol-3-phosphate acyltransferase
MAERSLITYCFIGFLCGASTVICGTLAVIGSIFSPSGAVPHKFARLWSKSLIFFCGAKVQVIGEENIPRSGTHIFIANHQSLLDIPVFFASFPLMFSIMAKKMLFSIPFMGWTMTRAGYIPVDKQDGRQLRVTLARARQVLASGRSLLIFPEGGRSPDGQIRRFKRGAFYLALKTGAPIIPVAICGSWHVLPKGSLRLRPGPILVHVGKPVETAGRLPKESDRLREEVEKRVKQALTEYSNKGGSRRADGARET